MVGSEKSKRRSKWMDFYTGKLPRKSSTKRKPVYKKIHECPHCSNKSNEGSGDVVDGLWICGPCIEERRLVPDSESKSKSFDDTDYDDGFRPLSPAEHLKKTERDESRTFWAAIFGVIIIAIILSLVERSRIFSVLAVVSLVGVYLLYRYEVKIK